MSILRTLWLVVVHDSLGYRYMDDITRNLFLCFVQLGEQFGNCLWDYFQWHTRLGLVCHQEPLWLLVPILCFYRMLTSSVIDYWRDAQQHGIYSGECHEMDPPRCFPSYFSLRRSLCLNAWNGLVQCNKRLWTHNMIRIKRTPPSLPPPPASSKPCSEIYSLVSWMVCLLVCSFVYSLYRVKASHRDE